MIPFDTLNQQNHDIAELSKVLVVLIQDREICDTSITCDLFDRYVAKVREHLDLEERNIYAGLLSHPAKENNQLATRFLNGAMEIKRIFSSYTRKWCKQSLHIFNHEQFLVETGEIFRLIQERVQAEGEELYPVARSIEQQQLAKSA